MEARIHESPTQEGALLHDVLDKPDLRYTERDSQGGSKRRCGLHATVTAATCYSCLAKMSPIRAKPSGVARSHRPLGR